MLRWAFARRLGGRIHKLATLGSKHHQGIGRGSATKPFLPTTLQHPLTSQMALAPGVWVRPEPGTPKAVSTYRAPGVVSWKCSSKASGEAGHLTGTLLQTPAFSTWLTPKMPVLKLAVCLSA